jgi:hypothetical protein
LTWLHGSVIGGKFLERGSAAKISGWILFAELACKNGLNDRLQGVSLGIESDRTIRAGWENALLD